MDRISAFMDGETSHSEAHQAILQLKQQGESRETWETFHLIGEAIRGAPPVHPDFMDRFHALIQQEPTVLAPRPIWRKTGTYALSAAASLAAVAVVLTMVMAENPLQPQPQIAAAPQLVATTPIAVPAPAIVIPQPVPAASQSRVNEYLRAHQEFSPSTTLQGVAPYVRTVSAPREVSSR